ncbi:WAT1-related protein At5g40240-like isoform X2 [Euphorbia lathyris]|uniref:WAT1-related protein At5g40240-like isoform X2 n=1 Tax=Euphorbia lathyris TaxID=212925 RepID=UPI0033143C17
MATKSSLSRMLPFAAMVTLECLDTGINTLGKAAMSEGISHFVLVVYSNALATLIMFFTSFICNNRITITQNCVFTGISYTSPTLASAIGQLVPAFTFILAVIFRMEKLDLRSSRRKFKVVGTLVSMLGALIVIFYKGPPVSSINFSSDQSGSSSSMFVTAKYSWVIGGLFITISSVSLSVFIIFQTAILKEYPSEMTIVSFYCLFGTIQCAVVSLIAEKNPDAWKLKSDIELISVVYSAVFGNVVTYGVATWCIHKKGPVFVAMFKPLGIAISVLISVMFLGDTVYFGSVIGATIIVVGFYCVIYSQSNEDEQNEVISIVKEPLLASQMAYYQGLSVER